MSRKVVKSARKAETNGHPAAVTLELPMGEDDPEGYQARLVAAGRLPLTVRGTHLNVQLGSKAARAFTRLRNGLRSQGALLPDGKPVWTNADALRYILEQIAESLEECA